MREREIILLVLLILIAFLGLYAIFPFSQKVQDLKKEVLSLKQEMEAKEKYLQKIKEIYDNLNKNEIFPLIQTALPEKPDYSDILAFLYKKASENGLILSSKISFSSKKTESLEENLASPFSLKILEISFSVIGNYQNFKNFLRELEFSQRFFRVKEIEWSLPKENFEIKMVVEAFHY